METNTMTQGKIFQYHGILGSSELALIWDNEKNCIYLGMSNSRKPWLRKDLIGIKPESTRLTVIPMASCEELGDYLFQERIEVNRDQRENYLKSNTLNYKVEQYSSDGILKEVYLLEAESETQARARAIVLHIQKSSIKDSMPKKLNEMI